jgi:serine/threonine protein kinase
MAAPRSEPAFGLGACASVTQRYERRDRVGEGTYGVIYKAWDRQLQRVVALKRLLPHNEAQDGFPLTSLREIVSLKALRGHANIVTFLDVAVGARRDAVFLALEFAEHGDLGTLLDDRSIRKGRKRLFDAAQTKCLARQLLLALRHCHERHVCHRDVKLQNLLYTAEGRLKLCDFGLARVIPSVDRPLTLNVVTLWYRAPEVLLRGTYAQPIDLWAAGCVIAEIFRDGRPLAPGATPAQQWTKIIDCIGAPSEETWSGCESLPGLVDGSVASLPLPVGSFARASRLNQLVPDATASALDLLSGLLCYDPQRRDTAGEALSHAWFDERPRASPLHGMPSFDPAETTGKRRAPAREPSAKRRRA